MYIELHAASAFSFLQGASLPETLIERAAALGYPALALLDADGVYGAPRFHKAGQQAGLRAIIGAELTICQTRSDPNTQISTPKSQNGNGQDPRHNAQARNRNAQASNRNPRSRSHAAIQSAIQSP